MVATNTAGVATTTDHRTVIGVFADADSATQALNALRDAAHVLGAELFVVVVPAEGVESVLESRAEALARVYAGQVHHSMRLEDQETGDAAWRARVAEIKATLLRTPSLLWAASDDGVDKRSRRSDPD